MTGIRARIGYTSPLFLTESFPYEFYKVMPDGVRLVLTTLAIHLYSDEEVRKSIEITMDAARRMAKAGVDLIILGGVPLNFSLGYEGLERTMAELRAETGVAVTSSLTMQMKALATLGARKIAVGHPIAETKSIYSEYLSHYGFEMVGQQGAGRTVANQSMQSPDAALELGRMLKRLYPDADTLYFPSPHWGTMAAIQKIEDELVVNAMSATLAILWDGLRQCGIGDKLAGYGRLLRKF
jgi:maleate cis-trans isomerase